MWHSTGPDDEPCRTPQSRETLRFGEFELDLAAYELRREGRPVRLERLPMDLLVMLVERRGELVTRAEIVDRLWGKDVFVDVETGVNTAIRKIRQALRDSAEASGLRRDRVRARAIASSRRRSSGEWRCACPRPAAVGPADAGCRPAATRPSGRARRHAALIAGALVLVVIAAFRRLATGRRAVTPPAQVTLAVLPFENLGGDPEREYLADGLTEDTIASLGQIDPERVAVIGPAPR